MTILTEPLDDTGLERFRHKKELLDGLCEIKVSFAEDRFVKRLILELSSCVSKPEKERNKYEEDIIEMILTLFRNVLSH